MGMIESKVAILTGSGRGIGAATAKMFGAEGASVVVSDLDPTPAEETAAIIRLNSFKRHSIPLEALISSSTMQGIPGTR